MNVRIAGLSPSRSRKWVRARLSARYAAAHRIISIPGVSTSNDDSEWIRSVVDVVDKKSGKPYDVEFRRNPTRRNLKAWMDGNNLRHIEPGEKAPEPWRPDARFKDKLAQRKMERERVEMR